MVSPLSSTPVSNDAHHSITGVASPLFISRRSPALQPISGPDALAKAELCESIVWDRLALDGYEYGPDERFAEYVGSGVCHAGIEGGTDADPAEVVLRMGVRGADRAKVDRFGPELVPLVTSGPPGVTGFAGGRPKATEVIGFWPALMHKRHLQTRVSVFES